ncbi:hypothetical protein [Pantoea sp. SO10]|uniref:hypothetical protein n=1 Tax=Pantoea sp. SO10 TaxID=2575375 RepID=UPI0010C9DC1D|nr:hypothetical protein [Pantoea sp. SO10]QCP60801.1 hypothetical protein FCN45_16045 [Pantoea sp. SO10]
MIHSFGKYVVLFMYSCAFFIIALLVIGLAISSIYYLKDGIFNFPKNQIERAIVFGSIAGTAVWLSILIFNLLGKAKNKNNEQ